LGGEPETSQIELISERLMFQFQFLRRFIQSVWYHSQV